eukprot:278670-Pelagomonas_calceolata.AAC.1
MYLDLPHHALRNTARFRLFTPFAMRQQLEITGLPQTVTFVRLMMMSRMNMSSFIAHIPRWCLSAGNMLPCSHRQDLMKRTNEIYCIFLISWIFLAQLEQLSRLSSQPNYLPVAEGQTPLYLVTLLKHMLYADDFNM